MRKILHLFSIFLITILLGSCTKESIFETQSPLGTSDEIDIDQTISSNKLVWKCPEFADILEVNFNIDDYFGDSPYPPFASANKGIIDKVMACPLVALEYCERECSGTTITFGYDEDTWLLSGSWADMPWSTGGIFTIAEQNDLANAAIALAIAEAPYCPNSNVKMEPVAYDLFWDAIFCCGTTWFVGVHVKYIPPCKAVKE